MSQSFVLQTVIYYSFPLIDVYELKHGMMLKCALIEAAVDSVTWPLTRHPWHRVHASGPGWHWSGRRRPGPSTPESDRAGAQETRPFVFIGGRACGGLGAQGQSGVREASPGLLDRFERARSSRIILNTFRAEGRAPEAPAPERRTQVRSRARRWAAGSSARGRGGESNQYCGEHFYMQLLTHKLQYISSHSDSS